MGFLHKATASSKEQREGSDGRRHEPFVANPYIRRYQWIKSECVSEPSTPPPFSWWKVPPPTTELQRVEAKPCPGEPRQIRGAGDGQQS